MITIKYIFSIILYFFASSFLFSQNPYIQNFKSYDYQGANKNWSISQDSLGHIYFGNDIGLLQYNGISWSLFKLNTPSVIRSVLAIDDAVYTGGYEEFGVWKRGLDGNLVYISISKDLPPKAFHNDDIWKIIYSDGKLYFQSFRSIFVYDMKNKSVEEVLNSNVLFLIKIYNELWVQKMGGGIYKLVGDKLQFINNSDIFSDTTLQTVLPFAINKYLIVTAKGLYLYDGYRFAPFPSNVDLLDKEINSAILSSDGYYYIGTILDGIYVIDKDGNSINHFNLGNQLIDNTVLSLYEDSNQDIWIGLDKGISCIKRFPSLSFYIDDKNKIGSIYTAKIYNGKLFIGTNQGLYYTDYFTDGKLKSLSELKKISSVKGQIWDLEKIQDRLYCATNKDLYVIDNDLKVTVPYNIHTGVFDILYDIDNSIYLGTYTSLYRIEPTSGNIIRFDTIKDPIIKVEIDHLGNIWLEHMNKGVYRSKLNSNKTDIDELYYYPESGDSHFLPYTLKLFKVGGRAALLGDNKFYIFDDIENSFVPYNLLDSLFTNINKLNNIYTVNKNLFWIISNNVAFKVFSNGANAFISKSIELPFHDLSFVNNFERIISLNDSLDLICLDKGFILSYPNKLDTLSKQIGVTPPIITGLYAINANNNDTIFFKLNSSQISIPYNYNTINISFFDKGAISTNLYFQYHLDGVTEWTDSEKIDNIVFQRLSVGKYTLRIRAINSYGVTSPETLFSFSISKPWYLSNIAYIIYLLILGCLLYYSKIIIQRKYAKKHQKAIEKLELKKLIDYNLELESRVKKKDAELLSQTSSIIKKNELMFKIKEELEVFNEKYPNKNSKLLFYKINTLLNSNLDSDDDWRSFMLKFEQKHPYFFKTLKDNYPQLTSNDLKLCACLRLNLDSKDIASFMNITVRAVENSRSRLRKKIGLTSDQNLADFFMSI